MEAHPEVLSNLQLVKVIAQARSQAIWQLNKGSIEEVVPRLWTKTCTITLKTESWLSLGATRLHSKIKATVRLWTARKAVVIKVKKRDLAVQRHREAACLKIDSPIRPQTHPSKSTRMSNRTSSQTSSRRLLIMRRIRVIIRTISSLTKETSLCPNTSMITRRRLYPSSQENFATTLSMTEIKQPTCSQLICPHCG